MTDDALIRAIAEDRGWRRGHSKLHGGYWVAPDLEHRQIPQWLTDANAAHELIEVLRGEGWDWEGCNFARLKDKKTRYHCCFLKSSRHEATADTFCRAVAECFARVRGIWKARSGIFPNNSPTALLEVQPRCKRMKTNRKEPNDQKMKRTGDIKNQPCQIAS